MEPEMTPERVTDLVDRVSKKIRSACAAYKGMGQFLELYSIKKIVNEWLMPVGENDRPTLDMERMQAIVIMDEKKVLDVDDFPREVFIKLDDLASSQAQQTKLEAERAEREKRSKIDAADRKTISSMMINPANPGGAGGGRRIVQSGKEMS